MLCNRHTTKEYVYNITSNFPETFIQSDLHTLQYHRLHAYRSNMGLIILIKGLNLWLVDAHLTPEPQPLTL